MSRAAWSIALLLSIAVHAALAMTFQVTRPGAAEPPAGAPITVSGSLASVLGSIASTAAPVEHTAQAVEVAPLPAEPRQPKPELVSPVAAQSPGETPPAAAKAPALTARSVTENPAATAETASASPMEALHPSPVPLLPRQAPPTATARPAPVKRQPSPKPASRTERAHDKNRQKAKRERRPPKSASRAGSNRSGAAGTNRGGKGGRSQASAGAVASYGARVRARILSNRPSVPGSGTVVVSFAVSSGGGLRNARVSRSSGQPALDRAALAAVRRSSPFPLPPPGAAPSQLQFDIPFSFR